MAKDDVIEIEGIVVDALPNAMFTVDIGNGHTILAHISGKLRMNFIKILLRDGRRRGRYGYRLIQKGALSHETAPLLFKVPKAFLRYRRECRFSPAR